MEDLGIREEFWRDRSVLITGDTGFKGSWLALWLQSLGARVSGIALEPPTVPSLFELARVAEGMNHFHVDIRDRSSVLEVMYRENPEIVLHLAAQSLVRLSYEEPIVTYDTNVMGTVNVLDAVRDVDCVRALVVVTSDKCYENKEWIWGYRESDALGGYDPYSSSKACAELVTSAYRQSYFSGRGFDGRKVAVATARAGNVIGGGDWAADRLIPDIVRAFIDGREVAIRNPHAIRPWQHVLDPLRGYILLCQSLYSDAGKHSSEWNFGPSDDDNRSVESVAKLFRAQWGAGDLRFGDSGRNPHEASNLRLDCSKARAMLGWSPSWSLERAIKETAKWYLSYANKEDMREFTLKQISSYGSR
jgi:CDP-glucose 4,6-dehydratase